MKLRRLAIRNFRCIDAMEIFPRSYTTLIGPNNAGKSSTIRAVELFLNQIVPSVDEWRKGHESEPIEIEADFDELLEWERAKPGVASLVYEDQIRLRLRILPPDASVGRKRPEAEYNCMKPAEEIDGWSENWGGLHPDIKTLAGELEINGSNFKAAARKESLRQAIRIRFPGRVRTGAPSWTSEGFSIDAALQQALPQAQVIPAIRDAEEDAAPGASTSFGVLLKRVIMPAVSSSEEYQRLQDAVAALQAKLGGDANLQLPAVQELADLLSEKLSGLITAKVSLGLDSPDPEKFIGSNTLLRLDDGSATKIGLQRHGLQRALIFTMLEVLAAQTAVSDREDGQDVQTRRTVLLFEEPELFMHPHLMRRLKGVLSKIAARPDWQVIISTHSPFLVDIADDRCSLVIHKRTSPQVAPTVRQLNDDPLAGESREEERNRLRALLDFNPTVCEAFFARNVVLVEGDTEMAALVRQDTLYKLAGVNMEIVRDTTVLSCDGKWTIIPVARLLREFGIPVRVVHDEDRKGLTQSELDADRRHEWHANARIAEVVGPGKSFAVADTFEHTLSTSSELFESKTDKPYRAWCRVRELCEGYTDLAHVPNLKQVLTFMFAP